MHFVLQGTSYTTQGYQAPAIPTQAPLGDTTVKKEDLTLFLSEITKTLMSVLSQNQGSSNCSSNSSNLTCALACLMCSGSHLVNSCPIVLEYIQAGKCHRNHKGKVVLSTGAFIPHKIPGKNLQEHIDKWHNCNPNQLAAATLVHTVVQHIESSVQGCTTVVPSYQLTKDKHITTLEAELFNLHTKKNVNTTPMKTRAQKARVVTEEEDEAEVAAARTLQSRIEEIIEEPPARTQNIQLACNATEHRQPVHNTAADTQPAWNAAEPSQLMPNVTEHPFRRAKDALDVPMVSKGTGV